MSTDNEVMMESGARPATADLRSSSVESDAAPEQTDGEGLRTFRGRTVEELLPQIREELGADAVVVRRRDGLVGGVGGFFQRPYVELEARASSGFDAYDEDPEPGPDRTESTPDPFDPVGFEPGNDFRPVGDWRETYSHPSDDFGPPAPGSAMHDDVFAQFSAELDRADRRLGDGDHTSLEAAEDREPAPAPAPVRSAALVPRMTGEPALTEQPGEVDESAERKRKRRVVEVANTAAELAAAGLEPQLAGEIAADTVSHVLPFAGAKRTRGLVRKALTDRIPVAAPVTPGRPIAFIGSPGSGRTTCVARLVEAYATGSDLDVLCIAYDTAPEPLASMVAPFGVTVLSATTPGAVKAAIAERAEDCLTVIDTPSPGGTDEAAIARLASALKRIGRVDVHLTLPATISAGAAEEVQRRLAPCKPGFVALTRSDETAHIGPVLTRAIRAAMPLSFVARRTGEGEVRLAPTEPSDLAAVILP